MEKRKAATGAKPATARPEPNEDAKKQKQASTTARLSTPKVASTPAPPSTSALSSRTSGTTINKPPTRPTLSGTRKPATRASEDGASTIGDGEENKRPARMSTAGPAGSRASRPDSATDRRRTTVGGSATSVPPKRPLSSARTSTASPTKTRTGNATVPVPVPVPAPVLRPTSSGSAQSSKSATSVSIKSTPSIAALSATETIPEEPASDDLLNLAASSETSEDRPAPPKLEIRSMKSSTPALKPQALSDNELVGRPRLIPRHSRTQSAVLPMRPMTAPAPAMSEREQGFREMEVMQSLLRESTKRDTLTSEVHELRAEMARLEEQNRRLSEIAASSALKSPTLNATKEKELKIMLTSQHNVAMDALKVTHKTAMSDLEEMHAKELQNVRSELDSQRRQSSRLEGVESKIEAVEEALRESKKRASLNEEEFKQTVQKKDEDKDKLGTVIRDLKREIDRCQVKLNEDVAKQAKEKKEAQKQLEQMRKELASERQQSKEAAEKVAAEKAEEAARFQIALKEARGTVEQEMERVRQAAADAEAAAEMMRRELNDVRKEDEAAFERNRVALEESASNVESLQNELQSLGKKERDSIEEQKRLAEESGKMADALREQVDELQRLREEEKSAGEDVRRKSEEAVERLQEEITRLQRDGTDGNQVLESLQTQLRELQQLKSDAEGNHEGELTQLRAVIEFLQTDSGKIQQTHTDALAQKDQAEKELNSVIEELQSKSASLQQQLEDTDTVKKEGTSRLQETIDSLKQEAETLRDRAEEQAAAKEKENAELHNVVSELQNRVDEYRQAAEDAKSLAEKGSGEQAAVVEMLQNEVQAAQHRLHDEHAGREAAESELRSAREEYEVLVKEVEGLRAGQIEGSRTRQEQSERIEEVLVSLADAEAAKSSAEASLASVKDEMAGLQKVLDTFEQDAKEREANHAHALEQLSRGLEGQREAELSELKSGHAAELASAQRDISSGREALGLLHQKLDAMNAEKEGLAMALAMAASQQQTDADEESERHSTAYRELQESLTRVKDEQAAYLARLSSEHETAVKELQDSIAHLKDEHTTALEALSIEHEHNVQVVMDKHAEQIAAVEEEASRRAEAAGVHRDRTHEVALAALEAEHADALKQATHSPAPMPQIRRMDVEQDSENMTEPPGTEPETPAKGLSHIFVNRADDINNAEGTPALAEKGTPGLAETPLAYASEEDEGYSPSPTPAYPKDGKRVGSQLALKAAQRQSRQLLEKENKELLAALRLTQAELEARKVDEAAETLESVPPKSASPELAPRVEEEEKEDDDRFTSPIRSSNAATTSPRLPAHQSPSYHSPSHISPSHQSPYRTPDKPSDPWTSHTTLEGTLASIRVQTEQLLDINDDFLAEQRRWSQKLGLRRSVGGHTRTGSRDSRGSYGGDVGGGFGEESVRSSPLRAAAGVS